MTGPATGPTGAPATLRRRQPPRWHDAPPIVQLGAVAASNPRRTSGSKPNPSAKTRVNNRRSARSAGRGARNRVGVPLHASCPRAVRSFRAGSLRCGRAGVDRRAAHSWLCDREPAWTGWAVGGPSEVAERRGTVRSVAQLSTAPHAATNRGTRLQVTLRLDMDDHSAEVNIVVTSHSTLDRGRRRRGPAVAHRRGPPRHASTAGKPHPRSSTDWSPTAADRPPQVPRRHAARHNHRGWRHPRRYDQIQPPTAASNDQIQAGDLSAAPQSRAWTADNTGLPRQQRSCR